MKRKRYPHVIAVPYQIPAGSKHVPTPVKLAFLSDLHCEDYGPGQQPLVEILRSFSPDAVLFGGDAFDERLPWDKALETFTVVANEWPAFYTPGNHEIKTGTPEKTCDLAGECGVTVLAGTSCFLSVGETTILLYGVEDPLRNEETHGKQMQECAACISDNPNLFSVLITHRPERVKEYKASPADLILTGHAHGGQWRIPGLINGVYGPDQGLFPKYAGGEYIFDHNRMLCSRGLGNEIIIPRIFNRPELLCITIEQSADPKTESNT